MVGTPDEVREDSQKEEANELRPRGRPFQGSRAQARGTELGCRHKEWVEAFTGAFGSEDLVH